MNEYLPWVYSIHDLLTLIQYTKLIKIQYEEMLTKNMLKPLCICIQVHNYVCDVYKPKYTDVYKNNIYLREIL